MNISVDFDGTLTRNDVFVFVKDLAEENHNIWILTSRNDDAHSNDPDKNSDLYAVAMELGIPDKRIRFQNGIFKSYWINESNISIHLDDNDSEINKMNGIGINVSKIGWKDTFKKLSE